MGVSRRKFSSLELVVVLVDSLVDLRAGLEEVHRKKTRVSEPLRRQVGRHGIRVPTRHFDERIFVSTRVVDEVKGRRIRAAFGEPLRASKCGERRLNVEEKGRVCYKT